MDDQNKTTSSFRAALEKFKQFARDCTEDAMRAASSFRNNSPKGHNVKDNKIKVIDNTKTKLQPIDEKSQDSATPSQDDDDVSHEEEFDTEEDEDLLTNINTKSNIAIQTIHKSNSNYNITDVAETFKDKAKDEAANNSDSDGKDQDKGSLMTILEKSDVSCTIIGDLSEDFAEACKIVCEYDEESIVAAKKCEYACLAVNKLREEVLKTAKEISNKGEHEKSEQRTIT